MMNVNCAIFVPQPTSPTSIVPIPLSPAAKSPAQLSLVVHFDAPGMVSNVVQQQRQQHYQNKTKMPQPNFHANGGRKCPMSFEQWSYMAHMRYQQQQRFQMQQQVNFMQQQQRTFFNSHQYQHCAQPHTKQQIRQLTDDETKSKNLSAEPQEELKQQQQQLQQGKRLPTAAIDNVKKFKLQNALFKTTTTTTSDTSAAIETRKDATSGAATNEIAVSKSGNRHNQSQQRQSESKQQQQDEREVVEKDEEKITQHNEQQKDHKVPTNDEKSKYHLPRSYILCTVFSIKLCYGT